MTEADSVTGSGCWRSGSTNHSPGNRSGRASSAANYDRRSIITRLTTLQPPQTCGQAGVLLRQARSPQRGLGRVALRESNSHRASTRVSSLSTEDVTQLEQAQITAAAAGLWAGSGSAAAGLEPAAGAWAGGAAGRGDGRRSTWEPRRARTPAGPSHASELASREGWRAAVMKNVLFGILFYLANQPA